ncbi:OmpA family protein [Schaalia odontolytica]|uniref:Photosystem I P700 chlorophyll a apoprotein A2 n=1 Tax=Schaalia odontolytica TaxID=1660 RepID=A0A2X0UG06_9ACTO|nr:OmpA family protein [Schaalia odontolytica]WMS28144.1 OmpA family protein [Schaalia odontolytica]SPT56088.1 Photosystem I P700 chlorophyll a apoprotein A2 [Schaalia odontolytica]
MNITQRSVTTSALVAMAALTLGACGFVKPPTPAAAPTAEAATPTPAQSTTAPPAPTVPGYRPGEIPPIPLFAAPSIEVFASNADKAVVDSASRSLNTVPGVTVSPAKCDGSSLVSGTTVFGGDGSVVSSSDNGTVVNDGQGGGAITEGPISIIYGADGSGTYSNGDTMVSLVVKADGSGTYSTTTTSIILDGQGGGSYSNSTQMEMITIENTGSGLYTKGSVTIINNGDGTGSYTDEELSIVNNGDGTATVNGKDVKDAPEVAKLGKLSKFPPITNLKPVESCGTVITLEDSILFDFGKSDIRPEAARTIESLATVLSGNKVPAAHIYGHTDSISDDAFNLQLSQERADAVMAELTKDGVSSTLDATGYGESKPIAPNENADGSDNPSGRALNRRVEIFIPTF